MAPDWLTTLLDEWGAVVCAERWGRDRLMLAAGATSYRARHVIRLCRDAGWDLEAARAGVSGWAPEPRGNRPVEKPTIPDRADSPRDGPPSDLRISRWDEAPAPKPRASLTVQPIPEDDEAEEPIEEAIERQCRVYERSRARATTVGPRVVALSQPGPIALVHFGDPHLDDDGCNWPALRRAVEVVQRTPHMYAGNVGDTVNNWVGRLVEKYAHQRATEDEGWRYARWLMQAVPWIYVVAGNHDCHDAETEALTRRGWLRYDEITDEDEVLSLDPETGRSEWVPIESRIVRDHDGEMVRIETLSISALVTPNHRVLHRARVGRNDWSGWRYCTADSMPSRAAVPVSASSSAVGVDLSDEQIALAGWILTDGCISNGRVSIYQSKDGTEIARLLLALELNHSVRIRRRDVQEVCGRMLIGEPLPERSWALTAEASREVMAWLPKKGVLPDWAHDLSTRQFEILLDAIIAGDGCWDGSSAGAKTCAVLHGRKEFLDSVQAVAVQHGWYARIAVARESDYRLNLCRRETLQFDRATAVSRETHAGTVWCLTVKHGNFMVRRNGAAHFSGNCWKGGLHTLRLVSEGARIGLMAPDECRVELRWPGGESFRLHVRHDFKGSSIYNKTHGLQRSALWDGWGDLYVCGHRHEWAHQRTEYEDGRVRDLLRVRGFKHFDEYARSRQFYDHTHGQTITTILDPDAHPADRVKVIVDVEEAADYLAWARRRRVA